MLKKTISIIFILLFMQSYASGKENLNIVTSISPLAYFIENIGGDHVDVTTLIPPGANPHTYEITPKQMNILSRADLYIKVGSGIEFEIIWMSRLKSINKSMPVWDASEGITLIDIEDHDYEQEHDQEKEKKHGHIRHGAKDPHIWLSPENAIIMAGNILKALINVDPSNSDYYLKNASSLIKDVKDLHQRISLKLNRIIKKQFYMFHPAWGYFARDFNLIQVPVEYSGKEPTPARLARLIKKARKDDIKVIFTSPQFSRKSADVIAREIKGKVVFIDPMAKEYIKNLEYTANIFLENLK